ncbi:MAG: hypothetical protein V9G12_01985 [Microthrixaceae bacterium]
MNRFRRLGPATVILFTLAGCGSDTGDEANETLLHDTEATVTTSTVGGHEPEQAESLDVCSMLDAGEIAAVLGEAAAATDQSSGDLHGCSWEGGSDARTSCLSRCTCTPTRQRRRSSTTRPETGWDGSDIMGLGDEASYSDAFGLEVLSGRYDVSVDNTGPTEKESDLTIAKRILEQLP